jgi:CRP/FNR family transcriptional regulator, cyclic AMP receptor protein
LIGPGRGFWGSLTPDERSTLRSLGYSRKYPQGATICVEGEPATHLFVLVDGWVKIVSVTTDGHETILGLRGDGEIVGEAAGEAAGRRNATMQALDDVDALAVSYDRFTAFLDAHSGASHAYRRMMAQRWSNADAMLRRRAVTSGAQRLALLLLDLAERHGSQASSAVEIALPLSQEQLGSLAGTSRATVARAFTDWRRRGFIRTGQRHITLIDLPGLRAIAG